MSDFLVSFFAGLASGITLVILIALIRRILKRRAEGEPVKVAVKEFRPLVAIAIGFALIFIGIFLMRDSLSGYITSIGAMILVVSAWEFLS